MLANARVMPMLPVTDIERAKEFYGGKLGLRLLSEDEEHLVYECGQSSILALYPRSTPTRADHTAVVWQVDDVASELNELERKGVMAEHYERVPGFDIDERGIASTPSGRGFWFKDPEGNILGVFEFQQTREASR